MTVILRVDACAGSCTPGSPPGDHLALHCGSIVRQVRGPTPRYPDRSPCRESHRRRRSDRGPCNDTSVSTRRSRLRCIRSAEPIHTSGSPPLRNSYALECSRKRPRMLRTRRFSLMPGTCGRIAQIPDQDVHRHPCRGGAVQGVDDLLVDDGVALEPDAGRQTRFVVGDLPVDALEQAPLRIECGATSRRWYSVCIE